MKIGLIGGTFDPVHNGHIRVAIEVKEQLDLDVIEFIPAPYPPHKLGKKILDFEKRVYLLKKAITGIPYFNINTIEAKLKGPSYTFYTLMELKEIYREKELYFVVGGDEVLNLTGWYRWRELFTLSNFIVVGRVGYDLKNLEYFIEKNFDFQRQEGLVWNIGNTKIFYIEIPKLEISSSMIREKASKGKILRGLVPEPIEKDLYIEYRNF